MSLIILVIILVLVGNFVERFKNVLLAAAVFVLIVFVYRYVSRMVQRSRMEAKQAADEIARKEREQARRREAMELEQRLEDARQQRRQEELQQPYEPEEAQHGFVLAYSYPDVEFDCPDPAMLARARTVPPHKQLALQYTDDGEGVEICYDSAVIGVMRPNKLRDMAMEFNTDDKASLPVSRAWQDAPMFSLFFYVSVEELARRWQRRGDFKKYTLTGSGSAEMQDNIDFLQIGESVSIDYDYDRGKYLVSAIGDIGYLPAGAEEFYTEHGSVEARVYAVTEKDSGKKSVSIMIRGE